MALLRSLWASYGAGAVVDGPVPGFSNGGCGWRATAQRTSRPAKHAPRQPHTILRIRDFVQSSPRQPQSECRARCFTGLRGCQGNPLVVRGPGILEKGVISIRCGLSTQIHTNPHLQGKHVNVDSTSRQDDCVWTAVPVLQTAVLVCRGVPQQLASSAARSAIPLPQPTRPCCRSSRSPAAVL